MDKINDRISIEVWDLDSMNSRLRPLIDRAAREDISLMINCHAAPREYMLEVSERCELLNKSKVPYELNVSFETQEMASYADFAG